MTFRIGFRFEPHVERMGGRKQGGTLYSTKRGAWRVVSICGGVTDLLFPVFTRKGTLYVLSPYPIHPGAFKSPKSVLDSYLRDD